MTIKVSRSFVQGVIAGIAAGFILTAASLLLSEVIYGADKPAKDDTATIDIPQIVKSFDDKVKELKTKHAEKKEADKDELERLEREALHNDREAERERLYLESVEEQAETYETYESYVEEDERSMIRRYCAIYGVSSPLATAISRLETGNWTSSGYLNANNWGGMMGSDGLMIFGSREAGCEAFVSLLKSYADRGMYTPEEMGPVYCPDGTGHWISLVGQLMFEELVG